MLLAVSVDDTDTRPEIPSFLDRAGVHPKVLLGDPHEPKGFNTGGAGMLFIVDRNGLIVASPEEFDADIDKQAESRVSELLTSDSSTGPLLFSIVKAPPGFRVLWTRPMVGQATALALAPGSKDHAAEIGVLDESHLRRYSPKGEPLGESALDAKEMIFLKAADLDGDGTNEWIAGTEDLIRVMDSSAKVYWPLWGDSDKIRFVGLKDLEGNGSVNLVAQDGSTVIAAGPLGKDLWRSPLMKVKTGISDPVGSLLIQTEAGIQALDGKGRPSGKMIKVAPEALLAGRIHAPSGGAWNVLTYPGGPEVQVLDRFAEKEGQEILVSERDILSVYSSDGELLLRLNAIGSANRPMVAAGDLDGRPGDEMVLLIAEYGLVALGVSAPEKAAASESIMSGIQPHERPEKNRRDP